jgi:FAD/FMN-containing dehydrogenase
MTTTAPTSIPGFAGELVRPGDDSYDRHRTVWNAMADRRPTLIARCTSAADVAAAVRFGRAHDLEIGVRCGGHGILGFAVPEQGLMIDLTPMGDVRVDADRRRAWVGGGALLGALDRATEPFGLATTAGNISHTGVGGLTLGGGMGWLGRQLGLACDNVETYTVVTAAGETMRASASEHPDLFWGLRGGGGNFGVVTEFEFRLHPISHEVLTAELLFDAADALGPLRRWADLLAETPREANMTADVYTSPNDPSVPDALRGRSTVSIGFVWVGNMAAAERWLGVVRGIDAPLGEQVERMRYLDIQTRFDAPNEHGVRHYAKDHYVSVVTDAMFEAFLSRGVAAGDGLVDLARLPKGGFQQFGGAIADVPDADSAFSHRDALLEWGGGMAWTDAAEDEWRLAAARAYGLAVEPHGSGSYVNSLSDVGEAATSRAYRPDKLTKLRELKRAWDPDNVFHLNQNVTPA